MLVLAMFSPLFAILLAGSDAQRAAAVARREVLEMEVDYYLRAEVRAAVAMSIAGSESPSEAVGRLAALERFFNGELGGSAGVSILCGAITAGELESKSCSSCWRAGERVEVVCVHPVNRTVRTESAVACERFLAADGPALELVMPAKTEVRSTGEVCTIPEFALLMGEPALLALISYPDGNSSVAVITNEAIAGVRQKGTGFF